MIYIAFLLLSLNLMGCAQSSYVPAWDKYVEATVSQYDIQPDCVPRRQPADNNTAYRGVAMLIHGFTACPQQYFDLMPILASEGYDVLVPLLPGEGAVPTIGRFGKIKDNIDFIPSDVEGYHDFVKTMNSIMSQVEGERVMAGLSVGGTTAANAGIYSFPGDASRPLYDRQLIMAPLLALPQKALQVAMEVMAKIPVLKNLRVGWGPGCEEERSTGRAGICQFTILQCQTTLVWGKDTMEAVTVPLEGEQTQVLFDWGDQAVSVEKIQEMYMKYGQPPDGKSICALPADEVHSFMSRYDNVGMDQYWLEELHCRIASFLTQSNVDQNKRSDLDHSGYMATPVKREQWPSCSFDCSEGACPFEMDQVVECPFTPPTQPSPHTAITKRSSSSESAAAPLSSAAQEREDVLVADWKCFSGCVEAKCVDFLEGPRKNFIACATDCVKSARNSSALCVY